MRQEEAKKAVIGLSRFGLGARPGDLAAIGGGIREALLEEAASRAVFMPAGEHVLPSAEAFHRLKLEREKVRELRLAAIPPKDAAAAAPAKSAPAEAMEGDPKMQSGAGQRQPLRQAVREIFQAETLGRVQAARQARTGFAERMVMFWSNHFCVSARKAGVTRILAGAYEREAIRPHVFGRFSDMLLAVEKHPAMLVYLDNEQSVGPNSRGGQRMQKGLNENLSREVLELHTLGADGGYSQEDVTSLARILTGWRFARDDNALGSEGRYVFNPNLHEPGDHELLGVVYREDGAAQGEKALLALARHPATARHIAKKLAIHFVSDTPDPKLVSRLEKNFRDTDGDLASVSKALIEAPEAWEPQPAKLRLPYEFLVASVRAANVEMQAPQINGALNSMGQPLWSPPAPNGFSDLTATWASPKGMKSRLDFAARFSQFIPGDAKPTELLEEI
ncbi:MAG TPA: DUF1800 family protein, partial [Hyphomicrobiales bacterium]|nr:DUF1800 family protein [Hyphomicrobiales bacterium]